MGSHLQVLQGGGRVLLRPHEVRTERRCEPQTEVRAARDELRAGPPPGEVRSGRQTSAHHRFGAAALRRGVRGAEGGDPPLGPAVRGRAALRRDRLSRTARRRRRHVVPRRDPLLPVRASAVRAGPAGVGFSSLLHRRYSQGALCYAADVAASALQMAAKGEAVRP